MQNKHFETERVTTENFSETPTVSFGIYIKYFNQL